MSSATESSSVQALKEELKSIKTALDAITSRPEFSASAYKYGGDPIYLQTADCPSPFIACDSAVMDCPEDKYGQPEMYTSSGQRCYQSGALARQAFVQEKERLRTASLTPSTLVGQIRELVKSAAALSSQLQGPASAAAAAEPEKKKSEQVKVCADVDEAHGYSDVKQRQQYCESLKDDTGNQQCMFRTQTNRCHRKTEAVMLAIAEDNRLAQQGGVSALDRAKAFVAGRTEGDMKRALSQIDQEERKNNANAERATKVLIEESVKNKKAAGIAGVIASILTSLANNTDASGQPTEVALKAQAATEWCINHGILINVVGVGLLAGAAIYALPAAELAALLESASTMISGLVNVQGVFLSSALNGMNAVWEAAKQIEYLPMLKLALTSGLGKLGLVAPNLVSEAAAVALGGGEFDSGVTAQIMHLLKLQGPGMEVAENVIVEGSTQSSVASIATGETISKNLKESALVKALSKKFDGFYAAVKGYDLPSFGAIAMAVVGPLAAFRDEKKTQQLFTTMQTKATEIAERILPETVEIFGTKFAPRAVVLKATESLAWSAANAASAVSGATNSALANAQSAVQGATGAAANLLNRAYRVIRPGAATAAVAPGSESEENPAVLAFPGDKEHAAEAEAPPVRASLPAGEESDGSSSEGEGSSSEGEGSKPLSARAAKRRRQKANKAAKQRTIEV